MRRALASLLVLTLAACASRGLYDEDAAPRAEPGPPIGVTVRQINGSREQYRYANRISLQYVVTITNPTEEPYEIDRIEIRSTVPGAYAIRSDSLTRVGRTIPPKMGLNVPVNAWGQSTGGRVYMDAPVTVAVAVYAKGPDQRAVVKRIHRTITNFDEGNAE